ncbi:hypothetical protein JB92DRAFT_3100223 [Gautieria morchelliformis]|nr:hypothetical protein JB92DRAFT_3100223 [Gautieria morchelliformis]
MLTMYICLAGQQLAKEKERRERNQCKKAAQAAHNKKEPTSQKHPADDAISPNQSHRAPLPDVIHPRCDNMRQTMMGTMMNIPPEKRTMRRRWRKMGPCPRVKQPWRANSLPLATLKGHARLNARGAGTQLRPAHQSPPVSVIVSLSLQGQRHNYPMAPGEARERKRALRTPLIHISSISSGQRQVVPDPLSGFQEMTAITHRKSQHSIVASSSISSGQRQVVPDPLSGFQEMTAITHRKSQHSIVASSSISSGQRQVVPDTLGGFRETTAITHRKSLVSLEESSSEEDTAPARGLKQPRTMSPNSDPESETPGNQAGEPVEEDTPAERQPKCQCDRKGHALPRASDYEGLEQGVLKLAQAEFQVRVCMQYAFPEEQDVDIETWAMACWDNACEHKAVKYRRPHTSAKHYRLWSTFQRSEGMSKTSQQRTRQEALRRRWYIFEDVATSMGIYEHPILQDVINSQWFSKKKKKSDSIVFGGAFNPIPDPVIVLVFTAVEYAIKQWASEFLVSGSQFSKVDYHDVYKRHLNGLEQWRHFSTRTAQALARHQQRLYSFGHSRAGFHDVPERAKTRFDNAKLTRAAAAIRDDSDKE